MSKPSVKNSVAKSKSKKWENPKVILDDPTKDRGYESFIQETEGKENKGGDPRLNQPVRTEISAEQARRQAAALERLRKRGHLFDT